MISLQRTFKRPVTISGVGVHSGADVSVTVKPARAGVGIVFRRGDLADSLPILANHQNVVNTQLATTLGAGSSKISTVEHLLSALQGVGVDNALVEVQGTELPILDGSALGFYNAFREAGIQTQLKPRAFVAVRRSIQLNLGEKWAVVAPSARFEVKASIEWDHPAIGFQEFHYIDGETPFSEVAAARTFGFLRDIEMLQKAGLARGGSLSNAVVLGEAFVLNPDGLRYPDEFVRHKVLDALGDFKLAGLPVLGYFRLHRAGHDLHYKLLSALFSNPANYEVIEVTTPKTRSSVHPAILQPKPQPRPSYAASY